MKKLWVNIAALVALIAVILFSGLFWLEASRRFPLPEPGEYVGYLSSLGADERTPMYLYRRPNSNNLLVSVFHDGWEPESLEVRPVSSSSGSWTGPLFLKSNNPKLRLIGSAQEANTYKGTVYNLSDGDQGEWELHPLSKTSGDQSSDRDRLQEWLFAFVERVEAKAKLDGLRSRVRDQESEIERLTQVITEGKELQVEGEQRFQTASAKLKEIESELGEKRKEAQQYEKQLEMAYRVTQMGRLVSLARESLERENRWIDSMLKTANKKITPELWSRYEKGLQILELQKNIGLERERIRAIQEARGNS